MGQKYHRKFEYENLYLKIQPAYRLMQLRSWYRNYEKHNILKYHAYNLQITYKFLIKFVK